MFMEIREGRRNIPLPLCIMVKGLLWGLLFCVVLEAEAYGLGEREKLESIFGAEREGGGGFLENI